MELKITKYYSDTSNKWIAIGKKPILSVGIYCKNS